jgi:hypothetical protein
LPTIRPQKGRPGRPKQVPRDKRLPVRGVVEPEELRLAKIYLAFGKQDRAEAYRRAYCRKNARGEWVDVRRDLEVTREDLLEAKVITPQDASIRGASILSQPHMQDLLAELQQSPGEHARQTLVDSILFGNSKEKADAYKQILADEDKLGFRDATEKWGEILCDVGAEVVVPLGVIKRTVFCFHCGESSEVEVDLAVEVPMNEFIPRAKPADSPN